MRRTPYDWRWIVVSIIVLASFGLVRLPQPSPLFLALIGGGGAWWLFQAGRIPWRGINPMTGGRETYWRGQRVILEQPRRVSRRPAALPLAMSIIYFMMSAGLGLATLRFVLLLAGIPRG